MIVPCPNCRRNLRINDSLAGRQGTCPACKHAFTIPRAPSPAGQKEGTPKAARGPTPAGGERSTPSASVKPPADSQTKGPGGTARVPNPETRQPVSKGREPLRPPAGSEAKLKAPKQWPVDRPLRDGPGATPNEIKSSPAQALDTRRRIPLAWLALVPVLIAAGVGGWIALRSTQHSGREEPSVMAFVDRATADERESAAAPGRPSRPSRSGGGVATPNARDLQETETAQSIRGRQPAPLPQMRSNDNASKAEASTRDVPAADSAVRRRPPAGVRGAAGTRIVDVVLSPDGSRYAYTAFLGPSNLRVGWDGQESKSYKWVGGLTISPDGKHVAHSIQVGVGLYTMVVDGEEDSEAYGEIKRPIFSPDSKRVAYVGVHNPRRGGGNKCYVALDGKPYAEHSGSEADPAILGDSLTFSPDGRRFAYVTGGSVVVDGKESERYSHCTVLIFSEDSRRVAYIAGSRNPSNGGDFVVVNGVAGPKYNAVNGISFSPNGKRLAYTAFGGRGQLVVVDGRESQENVRSVPVLSPDSKKVAYVAERGTDKVAVVVNGTTHQEYDEILGNRVIFSPDSRQVAYVAKSGDSYFVTLDGKKRDGLALPAIRGETLLFSPDGRHISYVAIQEGKQRVILDGKPGKEYGEIEDGPYFSPDGRHLAYLAVAGKQFLVVEGSGETEYTQGVTRSGKRLFFDGVATAYVWTLDGNAIRRVERQLPR